MELVQHKYDREEVEKLSTLRKEVAQLQQEKARLLHEVVCAFEDSANFKINFSLFTEEAQ